MSGRPPTAEQKSLANRKISEKDYQDLVNRAISMNVEDCQNPKEGKTFTRTCKEYVVLPDEHETRVKVTREVMQPGYKTEKVKGTRLVPTQKWKPVDETTIEVKETIEKKKRTVWKPVEEEYYEIVKKPEEVTKTRYVPYTDYCEEEVEMVVEVPHDKLCQQHGTRIDRTLGSKLVEIEKEETYKLVPTLTDDPVVIRRTEVTDHGLDYGKCEIGKEMYEEEYTECVVPGTGTKEIDYHHVDAFTSGAAGSSTDGLNRPPTGALFEDPATGKLMRQPPRSAGQGKQRKAPPSRDGPARAAAAPNPAIAAMLAPTQDRLRTPSGLGNSRPGTNGSRR